MVDDVRNHDMQQTHGHRTPPRGRWRSLVVAVLVAASLPVLAHTTAEASAFTCATTTSYSSVAYCDGDVIGLNAGNYPIGTRIALKSVLVGSGATNLVRTVSTVVPVSNPCPPGMICGRTIGTSAISTTVTFKKAKLAPPLTRYVDVYGTVTAASTLSPTGWAFNDSNNPAYW